MRAHLFPTLKFKIIITFYELKLLPYLILLSIYLSLYLDLNDYATFICIVYQFCLVNSLQ